MKKYEHRCAECGCTGVEMKMWVNPNLIFMHEQYQDWPTDEDECWCRDCDSHRKLDYVELPNPVKHLLITLEIQDGERQYKERCLHTTKATNLDFAVQRYAAGFFQSHSCYRDGNAWYQDNGEIAVCVESYSELAKYEYDLIQAAFTG